MAISLLSQVTVDITANNGSTSVTVPSSCSLAVLGWNGYAENGLNITTMTLNSVAHTAISGAGQTGTNDVNGVGMEYWISPSSGSQTLAWQWTNTPFAGEGPPVAIWFFSGTDTSSPIRAAGFDVNGASVTLSSNTTDYVLGYCATYSVTLDCAPSGSGQTNISAAFTHNGRRGRAGFENSPGASSTTFTADEIDGLLSVISIKESGGGGGGGGLVTRKTLLGVGKHRLSRDEWQRSTGGVIYMRAA